MIDDVMTDGLYRSIVKICYKKECDFFLAGSRRFSYHTKNSDLDMVVQDNNNIGDFLKSCGFLVLGKNEDYPASTYSWKNAVHVVVLPEPLFSELKISHEKVALMMDFNFPLIRFIKKLKRTGMKGSVIYRYLEQISKDQN